MLYAINMPWEQTNELLAWATETNAHLRITVRLAREWTDVGSQFLSSDPLHSLTIRKFPTPWTDRMLTGQLLPCSFRRGHRKFLFVSAILDQATVRTNGADEDAYVLTWPEGLQQVQRRFYYRAAVPDDMNLPVRIWPAVAAIGKAPTDPPIIEGHLLDISAGGALVDMPPNDVLELDRSYLVQIVLTQPEEPVLVLSQVRRIQPAEERRCSYSLQFLSLDQSPRGRETLMRLARFANYLRNLPAPQHSGSH